MTACARVLRKALPAAGVWIVASAALVTAGSVSAATVAGVDTTRIDGSVYVDLNDLLRPLAGTKSIDGTSGVVRIAVSGVELALLCDSPLVRGSERSWVLLQPVVSRNGRVWVPLEFLTDVVEPVSGTPIAYRDGLLFVDVQPGRIDAVGVEVRADECEVVVNGYFPFPPQAVIARDRIALHFRGCRPAGVGLPEPPADLVTDLQFLPEPDGVALELQLSSGVGGYDWRDGSRSRVILVLGRDALGLTPLSGDQPAVRRQIRRVVLDPARGGADEGGRLSGGNREKWYSLELARSVAERLRAAGYEVFLTRDEDRALTPEERAAFANETGADLFLSLAFESYQGSGRGTVQCFVHRAVSDERQPRSVAGYRLVPWERVQLPHIEASRSLASLILERMPADAGAPVARPVSLPLRLLQGLDMPAIEVVISAAVTDSDAWDDWRQAFARGVLEAVAAFGGSVPGGQGFDRFGPGERAEEER